MDKRHISIEMAIYQLLEKLYLNPKRLFLIDASGAILSAFLLGIVLVRLESMFGIPTSTLYFLALLPIAFALYDFYCFIRVKENIEMYLKRIAYVNLSYCCISSGLAFYHYKKITFLGWTYILLEIFILVNLANFEFRMAKLASKKELKPAAN